MLYALNSFGEPIPSEKFNLANNLWKMKQEKPFWEVMEAVVKAFIETQPTNWESFIIQLEEEKQNAPTYNGADGKRFKGVSIDQSHTNTHGMTNIYQVDIPIWIMLCIRKLYTEVELGNLGYSLAGNKLGKKFYREFGRRFPLFRIHESV